jgi:hypothetical protein
MKATTRQQAPTKLVQWVLQAQSKPYLLGIQGLVQRVERPQHRQKAQAVEGPSTQESDALIGGGEEDVTLCRLCVGGHGTTSMMMGYGKGVVMMEFGER